MIHYISLLTICRVIEHITLSSIRLLENDTIISCIKYTISELIRHSEPTPIIQKPCKEILVSIGGLHCTLVMDELKELLQPHQIGHFMVLETLGQLARSNLEDSVSYVKPILGTMIPMLSLIKQDYQKQSYANAVQLFCDAIVEYQTNTERGSSASNLSNEPDFMETTSTSETASLNDVEIVEDEPKPIASHDKIEKSQLDISAEIGITYDVIMQQWINTRDSKLCSEFLNVLSYMYPLLPVAKILENTNKIIHTLLTMYKRSVDRASISVFLSSVIQTTQKLDSKLLDSQADSIIVTLFDLICANPDFEKPVAVRSHNEVLRCYDLLAKNYGEKVMEIISTRFKSNDDREKVKALMLLTHLTNTKDDVVKLRLKEFLTILRQMVLNEKQFKMKGIILRAIVAFAQKGFIEHNIFVKFLVHHCCHLVKIQPDQGTTEEANEFVRSCNNTLIILSRTTDSNMDNLLKNELLQMYMLYEYTDACTTIAKCLSTLFHKNPDMNTNSLDDDGVDAANDEGLGVSATNVRDNTQLPSAESVFVRSLVLLANYDNKERVQAVLTFLLHFCPNLSGKHLQPLWNEKIEGLFEVIKVNDDDKFYKDLNIFITSTIKDIDNAKFSETLVNKMSDQFLLYQAPPPNPLLANQHQLNTELIVSNLRSERGMLMKIMGLCLCYVTDPPSVESKLDLIIGQVKSEKLEKVVTFQELQEKFYDPAKALGFASRVHYSLLTKKFEAIINDDAIKKSGSFFSSLQFTKDTQKESERYKLKILIIFGFHFIVQHTPKANILKNQESQNDKIVEYLNRQLMDMRECQVKKIILTTLLNITEIYMQQETDEKDVFKYTTDLLHLILKIPIENVMGSGSNANSGNYGFYDYLPLYPSILKLATNLIEMSPFEDGNLDGTNLLNITSHHFFTAAQNLNADDENQQSYLAPHINSAIPELNSFIKVLLQRNPSPAGLDDVVSILEKWMKEKNPQVRICASLIMEATLSSYIKTMKIGCEAPSKFHQTGSMLGKVVPRCIDSSGRVREICVNVLKKILELACIYETLTIPDDTMPWMTDLKKIREHITVDDNDEIITMAKEIASIIATRLTNQQYVTFAKTLLYNINDSDANASAGAALVTNYFIQLKGSEMFHAIPDLVKDSFHALKTCDNLNTKTNLFSSLVSLTKHHPKLVCAEMLLQPLPYDENVSEYWRSLTGDKDLTGTIVDNFLETISEVTPYDQTPGESEKVQKVLTHQPFAVLCALKEIIFSKDGSSIGEYKRRFASLFGMLLTMLATYTNTIPSMTPPVQVEVEKIKIPSSASKNSKGTRFSFIPNRDVVKVNPALVVMDTFTKLVEVLGMEQMKNTFQMFPQLVLSADLNNFAEFLPTLAVATGNTFSMNSSAMKEIIQALSKYMSSPCDPHRIAAVGFYSQVVPLKPCGEISSVVMLHLTAALSDPNPIVRGFCIRGLSFVGALTQHDVEKYSELALAALLKGIDDFNNNCFINIPLESLRGLSQVIEPIKKEKLDLFEVSLTIRIRPFFENQSIEIRDAAILLFGDLCHQTRLKSKTVEVSEALNEQLLTNLFPFLLHLGENESIISRVSSHKKQVLTLLQQSYFNRRAD